MHETPDDLDRLQQLLDASYAAAGPHLLEVISPERRLDAAGLVGALQGMCLLVLATSTSDGRPIVGPVDGIFFRGRFHFGSSPESIRFRHIRQRPAVSATHLPGEELSVTVHGHAELIDLKRAEHAAFRRCLLDVYIPRYGPEWEQFIDSGPVYARIEPARMFTYSMPSG
jgi:nitroimidazol reductase NimA-like FMN-containing flavoprotein (pyridoxamine 5'-phosphate oxidase superfamily)